VNVTSRDPLKRAYLSTDGKDRPLKSPVSPAVIDSARRYRLARLRQQLQRHDCAAALLYDPVKIRYALDAANMQLWTLHNAYRYALIFAEGRRSCSSSTAASISAVVCRGRRDQPCVSWIYMARPRTSTPGEAWSGEIVELLRRHGGGNKRIAIDKIEPLGLSLERAGYVLSRARAYREGPRIRTRTRSR
jgi:Xaa-Pro aminopeptidase